MGRALVLGGSGVLGRAICRHLIRQGHEVCSLSREGFPPTRTLGAEDCQSGGDWLLSVDWRKCDLANPLDVIQEARKLGDLYTIFHTVGRFKEPRWAQTPSLEQTNVISAHSALCLARLTDARRIVFISADETLGNAKWRVDGSFMRTKRLAERVFRKAEEEDLTCKSGWPITVTTLRPRFLYSPEIPFSTMFALAAYGMGELGIINRAQNPFYGALHVEEVAAVAVETIRMPHDHHQCLDYMEIKRYAAEVLFY